jgi:hypothetical protein
VCVCSSFWVIGTGSHRVGLSCYCDVGYREVNGVCVGCSATSYKPTISNGDCISCPTHAVVDGENIPATNSSVCICPLNSVRDSGACRCNLGYEWSQLACEDLFTCFDLLVFFQ